MGRQNQTFIEISDGRVVDYSFTNRTAGFGIRFLGPDKKRIERATGTKKIGEARQAARLIIEKEYQPKLPPKPDKATWDEVLAKLEKSADLRPESKRAYRTAIIAVRKIFPESKGPADITQQNAYQFKDDFMEGTYVRGKASDAQKYERSPTSCRTYLRCLRSLWTKHFLPKGFVSENPWLNVPYPNKNKNKKQDRRVCVPSEDVISSFFEFLSVKHPEWKLPRLFVEVKMMTASRTMDLCCVKTNDLFDNSILFAAATTKSGESRIAHLPAELVKELRSVAGKTWLWEASVEESKIYRRGSRFYTVYNPSTWRHSIENLFKEFNEGRPSELRLRPHDLRARAITIVIANSKNVDEAAHAVGVDPQTARHYLDAKRAFDRAEVMKNCESQLRGTYDQ